MLYDEHSRAMLVALCTKYLVFEPFTSMNETTTSIIAITFSITLFLTLRKSYR